VGARMEILLSADGAEALGERFSAIEGIMPILFQRDGTLTREGNTVSRDEVNPKGAWLSLDVLITKRVWSTQKALGSVSTCLSPSVFLTMWTTC